jgi:hypothetical protein
LLSGLLVTLLALASAAALALGSTPWGEKQGRANLWLSPDGGSCTRSATPVTYESARACSSARAAYDAANASAASSLILVKGGTHPPFEISGRRTSTKRIVFAAAPGERPVFTGGWMSIGRPGETRRSPAYVTLRNLETGMRGAGETPRTRYGVRIEAGSHHIRLHRLRAGGFLVQGSRHVRVSGGEYGPCRASKLDPPICDGNKIDSWVGVRAENVVVDGVLLHGYDYARSCALAGDCHYRSLYVNGVRGFTLRNSTIRDSVFAPWLTISGTDAARWGNEDVLIENNVFGSQVFFDQKTGARSYATKGLAFQLAWCENAAPGVPGYRNVTVRFNSTSRSGQLELASLALPTCKFENVRVYGNIVGARSTCVPGVHFRYNVLGAAGGRGVCDSTEVNIGRTRLPFYARDSHAPRRSDFKLAGPRAAPDGRVPASAGCPTTDRFGVRRGRRGFCDAGSAER